MLEKLIENWLDSASERTYQPIFCQILSNLGYEIFISTRHTPIEFGKDIIAVDEDGIVHAFQLKGNPGKILTLNEYRKITPQLHELMNQKIHIPGKNIVSHKSYLVTNGEIEESVIQAIENQNQKNIDDGYPSRILEVKARGFLLKEAKKLEYNLWPKEVTETKTLLEILTTEGDQLFPTDKFQSLLTNIFYTKNNSTSGLKRKIHSASLLTSICTKTFSEKENHWAIVTTWTMYATTLCGFDLNSREIRKQLDFVNTIIKLNLELLVKEVVTKSPYHLSEGNPITDFAVYHWRKSLLLGVLSLFWLDTKNEENQIAKEIEEGLKEFIQQEEPVLDIWGEAAFIQTLIHIWALEDIKKSNLSSLVKDLLLKVCSQNTPSVYKQIEEVLEHQLSENLEVFQPILEDEIGKGNNSISWSSIPLFSYLVYREEKTLCQEIWKQYSKKHSNIYIPDSKNEFCRIHSKNGTNYSPHIRINERWENLTSKKYPVNSKVIPNLLIEYPLILGLWLIICPQRAIPEAINGLHLRLSNPTRSI
ncbi:hypothetical protein [Algoriphagus taiwanensis]|uniref:Uncharacterized protein n=1 Tax=Algoriphagus taiwanensis TaxID=1445656 RepID=A0ABQ6Q699_9BACT|nr:hypothetical protein Ataiwa_36590 [Algoriphagus taiwanensis]